MTFFHFPNLKITDYGPTDRRTDRPSYRDARTHLKIGITLKKTRVFLESIPSYANQLSDQRQVPDVTGSGAKIASKWQKEAKIAFLRKKNI